MNETVRGRIYFHGNPWPNGHRIAALLWYAVIRPEQGLSLQFSLESAPYCEEDDGAAENDQTKDWARRSVWKNYHSCTIEPSTTSQSPCIPLSDGTTPFAFDMPAYEFRADPLPLDIDTVFESGAFSIYLLGHDATADHRITLTRAGPAGCYDLHWTAKIALAYVGESEFQYGFEARANGLRFDAINLSAVDPAGKKLRRGIESEAFDPRDCIARYVTAPESFNFEKRNGALFAVRRYD